MEAHGVEDRFDHDEAGAVLGGVAVEHAAMFAAQVKVLRLIVGEPPPVQPADVAGGVVDRHGHATVKAFVPFFVEDAERLQLPDHFAAFRQRLFQRAVAVTHAKSFQQGRIVEAARFEVIESRPVFGQRAGVERADPLEQFGGVGRSRW